MTQEGAIAVEVMKLMDNYICRTAPLYTTATALRLGCSTPKSVTETSRLPRVPFDLLLHNNRLLRSALSRASSASSILASKGAVDDRRHPGSEPTVACVDRKTYSTPKILRSTRLHVRSHSKHDKRTQWRPRIRIMVPLRTEW